MKKFRYIFLLTVFLVACDDGDVVVENISFDNVTTQTCSNSDLIYKIKEQESLILLIPKETFTNEPTPEGKPVFAYVGNGNRIVYRFYDGKVATANICDIIPPAVPNVSEQWEATAGKIQITITANKKVDEEAGSTRITNYTNNIVFKDLTFAKPAGTQVYQTFPFGDYVTSASNLSIVFDPILNLCDINFIYAFSASESLVLANLDPALLSTANLGQKKSALVGTSINRIELKKYTGGVLTQEYFCNETDPVKPEIDETWNAVAGVEGVSGIIEVTSSTNGPNFIHKIVFRNVIFEKGNSNFKLGTEYLFGELLIE